MRSVLIANNHCGSRPDGVVTVSDRSEGRFIEFDKVGRLFSGGVLDGLADDAATIVEKDRAIVHGWA
jgi:hypothetical protein